eukprot:CAMPEP_0205904208 /NCGR_PEP_ID=MMETSP1325-20131115/583_1 /ASSEMBLY_ACC=CAM_ASM_000708 /TAXON_ID=236786 /ORGANISM="Florenciella sp., Strain RCC1007" /LENGTH=101 /DNA_ID=CAMNT_0053269951 /DNA_START=48 /DNA_END=350 /DNA_ORIENTATION=-
MCEGRGTWAHTTTTYMIDQGFDRDSTISGRTSAGGSPGLDDNTRSSTTIESLPYKLTKLNAVREQHLVLEFTQDTYVSQVITALGTLVERLCNADTYVSQV